MTLKIAAVFVFVVWTGAVIHTAGVEQAGTKPAAPGSMTTAPKPAPTADAAASGKVAAAGQTTWSGVFSDEQAKSGVTAYAKACAECHQEDLAGDGFAPALKGPEFMSNWNTLTVGELFERIRVSMPPNNPNSVTAKEKADIVAHLLKSNGFPAGKGELATTTEALKAIKFEASKPGR